LKHSAVPIETYYCKICSEAAVTETLEAYKKVENWSNDVQKIREKKPALAAPETAETT